MFPEAASRKIIGAMSLPMLPINILSCKQQRRPLSDCIIPSESIGADLIGLREDDTLLEAGDWRRQT